MDQRIQALPAAPDPREPDHHQSECILGDNAKEGTGMDVHREVFRIRRPGVSTGQDQKTVEANEGTCT